MVTAPAKAPHPAKYTDRLLPTMAEALKDCRRIIDFNAGTCKAVRLRDYGVTAQIICLELEPEWAEWGRDEDCLVLVANAERMPLLDSYCDGAAVSVVYGNRMSDCHNARDSSRRNTYTHVLGRKLTPGNTGAMQWGTAYRESYTKQYTELKRVLCDKATFVLNVSDHIRKGEPVPVTQWHMDTLTAMGFEMVKHDRIPTPRNKFGANGEKRVDHESVITFRLHKAA